MLKKAAFAVVMILALTCTACATAPEQTAADQPRAERSERRNTSCPAYAGCRTYPQASRDGAGDSQNAATYPRGPF